MTDRWKPTAYTGTLLEAPGTVAPRVNVMAERAKFWINDRDTGKLVQVTLTMPEDGLDLICAIEAALQASRRAKEGGR